ncbi:MAG: bacteriohemerythrin [Limnochordia bacterium]|nr:hemerythrin family protein [Bacillota bacterium]
MAIQWTSDLATGITTIDDQHKELFARVNKLLAACSQGRGKEEVGNIIGFLEEYVVTHFADEEKLQQESGYPEFAAHKRLHDAFKSDLAKLKDEFEAEGPTLRFVVLTNRVVVDWLMKHIAQVDKAFGNYLRKA